MPGVLVCSSPKLCDFQLEALAMDNQPDMESGLVSSAASSDEHRDGTGNPDNPEPRSEDVDLENILAMFGTNNDILTKLEEAAQVLLEIVPFFLPAEPVSASTVTGLEEKHRALSSPANEDYDELFRDALSVLCGDLAQLLQLGLMDPTHGRLFTALRILGPESKRECIQSPTQSAPAKSPEDPEPVDSEPVDVAARRKVELFEMLLDFLKDSVGLQSFLSSFLHDEALISSLYLTFSSMRNAGDIERIGTALLALAPFYRTNSYHAQLENQVENSATAAKEKPVSPTSALSAAISSAPCSPTSTRKVDMTLVAQSAVNEYKSILSNIATPGKSMVRQHSRSRSDGLPQGQISSGTRPMPIGHQTVSLRTQSGSGGRGTPNFSDSGQSGLSPAHSSAYLSPAAATRSLIGYLQAQDTETCADLERENAHFFVCEAVISAMEQMHYERRHGRSARMFRTGTGNGESDWSESPAERNGIKSRGGGLGSNGMSSASGSDSVTTASSSIDGDESVTRSAAELDVDKSVPLDSAALSSRGIIGQSASLPPDRPRPSAVQTSASSSMRTERSGTNTNNSAEFIAITLLRKFQETHLPSASELDWLVSEQDVPQSSSSLLPLPRSTCIAPAEAGQPHYSRIRGNLEWAPLRPQIIYHMQPHTPLKAAMVVQKSRCAGCGGKMDPAQQARMRFCEYTGKFFCVCCHEYKTSLIPARILQKWDFSKHYVSNYAADFIGRIYRDPLFDVSDCNRDLYKRSKLLNQTRILRTQLVVATEYIKACRHSSRRTNPGQASVLPSSFAKCELGLTGFAIRLCDVLSALHLRIPGTVFLETGGNPGSGDVFEVFLYCSVAGEIQQLPRVVYSEIHTFSLEMFCSIRDGIFPTFLKPVAELAMQHVLKCKDCGARGYICEFCHSAAPIFPFQFSVVHQCLQCFSCYHTACFKKGPCPKCKRIEMRRAAKAASVSP